MLTCVAMLSGVAFYNGYPLVYSDTGSYLMNYNFAPRSFFYNLFLVPAHLTHSLWTPILLQAVLTFCMLRLILREVYAVTARGEFLAIVVVLCVLTSLPWIVGFVMPDIFTPMLVLGIFMLTFCFEHLSRWERYFVMAVTLVSVVVQYSHPPLALGLAVGAFIVRYIGRDQAVMTIGQQVLPVMLVGAGVVAIVALNHHMIGMATLSPGGYAFELSRLIEDGSAVEYLRDQCPTHKYAACEYLPRMPMTSTDFLWSPDSIFHKVGFLGEREEGMEIIRGTIEAHPLWVLRDALGDTSKQLELVETGVGLESAVTNTATTPGIAGHFPKEFKAYFLSRQGRGELLRLPFLQQLHLAFVLVSLCYCFFAAGLFARDREWMPIYLMMTVGLGTIFNAFVTGALSQPHPRYGARLVWLIPLMALGAWRKAASVSLPTSGSRSPSARCRPASPSA